MPTRPARWAQQYAVRVPLPTLKTPYLVTSMTAAWVLSLAACSRACTPGQQPEAVQHSPRCFTAVRMQQAAAAVEHEPPPPADEESCAAAAAEPRSSARQGTIRTSRGSPAACYCCGVASRCCGCVPGAGGGSGGGTAAATCKRHAVQPVYSPLCSALLAGDLAVASRLNRPPLPRRALSCGLS